MFKPRSLFHSPARLGLGLTAALMLLAAAPGIASATVAATAPVNTIDSFRGKTGQEYTFTVTNTKLGGAPDTIGSFEITRPSSAWTITGCSTTRSSWTAATAAQSCQFTSSSNSTPANSIPTTAGINSETFTVTATISAGDDTLLNSWGAQVAPTGNFSGAKTTATGTRTANAWSFEITNAIVQGTSGLVGAACPASSTSAPAASTQTVVICGRAWGAATRPAPTAPNSLATLGGTMFSSGGTFSGSIASIGNSPVVLANYTGATITPTAGAGKTVIGQVGNASGVKSPSTTLNGYNATLHPTGVSAVSGTATYGGTMNLTATLSSTVSASGISGKTVNFEVDGTPVGSGLTNGAGVATFSGALPPGVDAGTLTNGVDASFTTDTTYSGSTGSGDLSVDEKDIDGSFTADDKVYDGDNVATISDSELDATDIVGSDIVTLDDTNASATFADPEGDVVRVGGVAVDQVVTSDGFELDGADEGNYNLVMATDDAAITPKTANGSFTADDKVYDGDNTAAISASEVAPADIVGPDVVDVDHSTATATFADPEGDVVRVGGVAVDQEVTGSGFGLQGADANNYDLTMDDTDDAAITPKTANGSFTADDKVYDGDNTAAISASEVAPADIVGPDVVDVDHSTATATFADPEGDVVRVGGVAVDQEVTGSGFGLQGADANNYDLTMDDTDDAAITPKTANGSFTADDKVYDGDNTAAISASEVAPADIVGPDVVDVDHSTATATFADPEGDVVRVGGVAVDQEVTGSGFGLQGADANNYDLTMDDTDDAAITPKTANGSFTADDKVYDGDNTAAISASEVAPADIVGPDVVDVDHSTATATFADPEGDVVRVGGVAVDQEVTGSGFGLQGADANNYDLTMDDTDDAKITPKTANATFTADDKVYDGDNVATISNSDLDELDIIAPDTVTLDDTNASATFADPEGDVVRVGGVAVDQTVTSAAFDLAGADADNYDLAMATDAAKITPKPVDGSFTADDKEYDGTTAATVTGRSVDTADLVDSGDDVSLTGGTATFGSPDVGTRTATLAGASLSGADAGNYEVGTVGTTTADITPKSVTGDFTAANKVYNGSSAATVTGRSLSGVVGTEDVSLSGGSASFANPNVGNNKTVTLTGAVLDPTGADVGNYTLASVGTDTANITKKSVTGSFTAADKDFDGTTAATITSRSLSGAIGGDDVSLVGGTAAFGNANPGVDKFVSGTGFSLGGSDAGNYALSSVGSTTATINQRDPAPGGDDDEPTEEDIAQGASDKLGGDVKPAGLDFGGKAFAFAPEDQGKKLDPKNQPLFAIGCIDDCDVTAKKKVVLTTDGASAAATRKLKLKTQTMTLASGELGVVKLKLKKKQRKAIKKAKKAKLVVKVTIVSGGETVTDKKTYKLKT